MILWLSWKINLKIYSPVFCMFFKKLAKRSGFLIKIEYILPKKIKMEIKLKKQHWFGNVC